MSERDPRSELADISRALGRRLRREGLTGGAELLLRSAAIARREGIIATRGATASQARSSTVSPEASLPVEAVLSAGWETPVPESSGVVRETAAPVATSGPTTNLFGEPEPVKPAAVSLDRPLPPHHEPLFPIEASARVEILSRSLPVLETIAGEVNGCTMCGLCETRTRAVPGVGSASSGIVFVGEAPGADEDAQGEPFVGRAGQLLTRIIQAMDDAKLIPGVPLNRQTVFICNVLKCRPPENRNPLPHEIEKCSPYLYRQLEVLQPKIICCLGKFAAELLVGVKGTIRDMRGKTYRYKGSRLIVTYHPAACLRTEAYKKPVWEDMHFLAREYLAS
jgi:DNA polymerase